MTDSRCVKLQRRVDAAFDKYLWDIICEAEEEISDMTYAIKNELDGLNPAKVFINRIKRLEEIKDELVCALTISNRFPGMELVENIEWIENFLQNIGYKEILERREYDYLLYLGHRKVQEKIFAWQQNNSKSNFDIKRFYFVLDHPEMFSLEVKY